VSGEAVAKKFVIHSQVQCRKQQQQQIGAKIERLRQQIKQITNTIRLPKTNKTTKQKKKKEK